MNVTKNPLDADNDIIGKRFKVTQCEAREHGDNEGCVCYLIGREVTVLKRYESTFCGHKFRTIASHPAKSEREWECPHCAVAERDQALSDLADLRASSVPREKLDAAFSALRVIANICPTLFNARLIAREAIAATAPTP